MKVKICMLLLLVGMSGAAFSQLTDYTKQRAASGKVVGPRAVTPSTPPPRIQVTLQQPFELDVAGYISVIIFRDNASKRDYLAVCPIGKQCSITLMAEPKPQ